MRNVQEYLTPPGYYDRPYTYVYWPDELASVTSLITGVPKRVASSEDYFVLRQVKFANMVMGLINGNVGDYDSGFRFRDALGRDKASRLRPVINGPLVAASNPGNLYVGLWPIAPEIVYPRNSAISMDVNGVTRGYNGTGSTALPGPYFQNGNQIACSQIQFVGARRVKGADPIPQDRAGRAVQEYVYPVTVTLTTPAAGPSVVSTQRIYTTITGWHFELTDISIVPIIPSGTSFIESCRVKLYDAREVPTSDTWLSTRAFNTLGYAGVPAISQTATPLGMGALCVPLWFPDQTSILMEVYNSLSVADVGNAYSTTVTFLFHGRKWFKRP